MDWSVRNRDLVAHHIIENAKSGDIVLLHDPYDTSVEAALQTIDVLSEQGYEFVTLEGLFSNAGVTPQADTSICARMKKSVVRSRQNF